MPRAKFWCWVLNNPREDELVILQDGAAYIKWQLERGERGTPHYQGYLECKKSSGLLEAKRILGLGRSHLEPTNSAAYIAYVWKEESRIGGPWQLGREPGETTEQCNRNGNLKRIGELLVGGGVRNLRDIAREYPIEWIKYGRGIRDLRATLLPDRDRHTRPSIKIYLGDSGKGKSRSIYDQFESRSLFKKAGTSKWFNGYDGQEILWLEEFTGWEEIPPELLLQICDWYPLELETKFGFVPLSAKVVILSSTQHWGAWYKGTKWEVLWQTKGLDFQRRVEEFGEVIRIGDT